MGNRSMLAAAAIFAAGLLPLPSASAGSEVAVRVLERNKAVARRVYEEGLSQGLFEVPYTMDFVGHGAGTTFTHADGMAEAKGWREALPDLTVAVDLILAESDLVSVRWTARGTNTGTGNYNRAVEFAFEGT